MKVDAIWDRDGRDGWKYRIPGIQGFVAPMRKTTSVVSSNEALVREVQNVAFAVGVKLPTNWELTVRR